MRTSLALAGLLLLSACPVKPGAGDGGLLPDGGTATAPVLTQVTANVTSRTGRDLTVTVVAVDPEHDVASAVVRTLDAAGNPFIALDTNRDGVADSAETRVTFSAQSLSGDTLTASAVLPGLGKAGVSQVAVTLVDLTDLVSDEVIGAVQGQSVEAQGATCDPSYVTTRCAPGLGCRGTPPTCQEGLPPQITRFAFFRNAAGPTILLEGTEPEDDLANVRFEFKNASGVSIMIDSDGDTVPDLSSFTYNGFGLAQDGVFFVSLQAGVGLDTQVPTLVATATDAAGHTGASKSTNPANIPIKGLGQPCDAHGFDACAVNLVCSPGLVGATNKCVAANTLLAAQCAAAPVLTASPAGALYVGATRAYSLYDAPTGCSTNDPKGRPDALVRVHLDAPAATLTLSTVGSATNFDTTLYVLPGCAADSSGALACNDDVPGTRGASQLALSNVAAGDLLVVIDSFNPAGGTFQLIATVP